MSESLTRAHVLSNGEYSVLLTPAGNGYAALRGYALTAWAPDPTADTAGSVCYIRDRKSLEYWSLAFMPCARAGASGWTRAYPDRVESVMSCNGIDARSRTFVAAGVNAEVRRIELVNRDDQARTLDVTTFAELALITPAAYVAHPAFAKLFVQTAYDAKRQALIAWRRPRSPDDRRIWLAQRMVGAAKTLEYETDRARFIGRTRSLMNPLALSTCAPLGGNVGTVLDPAFCLRTVLELGPGESAHFDIVTFAADTRVELEQMLDSWVAAAPSQTSPDRAVAALGLPHSWQNTMRFDAFDLRWAGTYEQPPELVAEARASYGAFSADGAEYVLKIGSTLPPTPQPWINVIANEDFGCLISETGAGYSWAANSRENRITPWINDAVTDAHTEALYVRDNDSGAFWSVFPGPAPCAGEYEVRHGLGYSRFKCATHQLVLDACVFVPRHDPCRIVRLTLVNHADHARRLSVIAYAQLVLGTDAAESRASIATRYDEASGVIYASNGCRGEFSERVAFATAITDAQVPIASVTCSRASFLGQHGSMAAPSALNSRELDGRFGSSLDPCAALQVDLTIPAGGSVEAAFLLGEAEHEPAADQCVARYRTVSSVDAGLSEVTAYWRQLVGRVHARTPVTAFDLMLNGWVAYQNLACRMWARSAFYQSGGAFGFRDQLQDAAALLYLDPQITRNQILLHAAHQFVEGDVLHWWHPPTSKGIRTRFSDDLLWLPYITLFYVARTGDHGLFDESVRYVTAQQLARDEDEVFVWPQVAAQSGTIYEHCCNALDRSLTRGAHGLPLMGVGDWNDGMNRVGREGRGESVWLGFFLFDILHDFITLCERRNDGERAARYVAYLKDLAEALNDAGWDGEWYRRAYYDNGAPLGSKDSDECKIDALAQAWAVLSRAAPIERAEHAVAALKKYLVSERDGIIRLLTPPFDHTPYDPGYIKGYVPGVRENGGQYTHAAIWAVRALAELNDREHAAALLELLTPVSHTRSGDQTEIYKGEPYAIAADVYGVAPHVGRAGWTWYTGSAGWLYRVILESILGFTVETGGTIKLRPCIPAQWPGFTLSYRFPTGTRYTFAIEQDGEITRTSAGSIEDGAIVIAVDDDGAEHQVQIQLGRDVGPRYQPRLQSITAP